MAWAHEPKLGLEGNMKGLAAIAGYLNTVGITSVIQTHASEPIVAAAKRLEEQGTLTLRLGVAWTWNDPQEVKSLEEQGRVIEERHKYASEMISVDFVKISVDGNPGSTAYMLEPYAVSGGYGDPTYTDEELFETIEHADRMGLGVHGPLHRGCSDATVRQRHPESPGQARRAEGAARRLPRHHHRPGRAGATPGAGHLRRVFARGLVPERAGRREPARDR